MTNFSPELPESPKRGPLPPSWLAIPLGMRSEGSEWPKFPSAKTGEVSLGVFFGGKRWREFVEIEISSRIYSPKRKNKTGTSNLIGSVKVWFTVNYDMLPTCLVIFTFRWFPLWTYPYEGRDITTNLRCSAFVFCPSYEKATTGSFTSEEACEKTHHWFFGSQKHVVKNTDFVKLQFWTGSDKNEKK